MVANNQIGTDFAGVVRYQFEGRRDQPTDKKPEILGARGVGTGSAAEVIADFEMGRQARPGLKNAVWHVSLSFNPEDAARLDSARMRRIAEDYLKELKLTNTQYLIVRHHDAPDNQHVHILVNRIDDNGRTLADGRNFHRSKEALQKLIKQHGLTPPTDRHAERQRPERLHGTELIRHELREVVRRELRTATERPALLAALRDQQFEVRERLNQAGQVVGISFAKDKVAFKGSELARELSSTGIDRQLMANREQIVRQQAAAARQAAADEQAASEALVTVRRQQQLLSDCLRQAQQAEHAGSYGQLAQLRYGLQPELEAKLATAREQVAQIPCGQLLLREYDAEQQRQLQQKRARRAAEAEQQRRDAEAKQAQELAQQNLANALRDLREQALVLAAAKQQLVEFEQAGREPQAAALRQQIIEPAERRLAASRRTAEQSPAGQVALAEVDERIRQEQQADQTLRQLARQPGLASWEQFSARAEAAGYFLAEREQTVRVVANGTTNSTSRELLLPDRGRGLHRLVSRTIGQHEWEQRQLKILDGTVAQRGWGLCGVRLLVEADYAKELQQKYQTSLTSDALPGLDGRLGVTLCYNPGASTWTISAAVEEAKRRGGQVIEWPQDAQRREQSTRADYDAPGLNRQRTPGGELER